jgi:hypothetical protein
MPCSLLAVSATRWISQPWLTRKLTTKDWTLASDRPALGSGSEVTAGPGANCVRFSVFRRGAARHTHAPSDDHGQFRPLRRPTGGRWRLATSASPLTAAGEVLTALIAQWLTVQVTAAPRLPAVIISGADELTRTYAERLDLAQWTP